MALKWFVRQQLYLHEAWYDRGWGCGYVILPIEHPCYNMDYNTIHQHFDIDVHGGLTYAEETIADGVSYWVVGFDTAHCGDDLTTWSKDAVEAETIRLKEQLEKL